MNEIGILIDMGDTLIHNNNFDFKRSLEYMYNISLTKNNTLNYFLDYSMNILKDIFKERNFIEIKLIDFLKQLIELFDFSFKCNLYELELEFSKRLSVVEIIDGSIDLLKYFKSKNYKVIVLSNTCMSRNVIISILEPFNKYLDDVIVSSDYCVRKPHFSFFEIGIKRLNIDRSNIYFIGNDFYYDVYGSNNVHINSIWFNEKCIKPNIDNLKYIEIKKLKDIINKGIL